MTVFLNNDSLDPNGLLMWKYYADFKSIMRIAWEKSSMNILLNISECLTLVCNVIKWFLAEHFLYFEYSNNRKAI